MNDCHYSFHPRPRLRRLKRHGWTRSAKFWLSSSEPAEVLWTQRLIYFSSPSFAHFLKKILYVSDASQQKSSDSVSPNPTNNTTSISLRLVLMVDSWVTSIMRGKNKKNMSFFFFVFSALSAAAYRRARRSKRRRRLSQSRPQTATRHPRRNTKVSVGVNAASKLGIRNTNQ